MKSQERVKALNASAAAWRNGTSLLTTQYQGQMIDYTPVGYFAQNLLEQQDQAAQAQGDVALALVEIYRALGGGWQVRLGAGSDAPKVEIPQTQPILLETLPPLVPTHAEDLLANSAPVAVRGVAQDPSDDRNNCYRDGAVTDSLGGRGSCRALALLIAFRLHSSCPGDRNRFAVPVQRTAPLLRCRDNVCPKLQPCVPCGAARQVRRLLSEAASVHHAAPLLRPQRLLPQAQLPLPAAVLARLVQLRHSESCVRNSSLTFAGACRKSFNFRRCQSCRRKSLLFPKVRDFRPKAPGCLRVGDAGCEVQGKAFCAQPVAPSPPALAATDVERTWPRVLFVSVLVVQIVKEQIGRCM